MRIICSVPVRKGRKGISGKTFAFWGISLLYAGFLILSFFHMLDEVCVSTDCNKTMNIINRRYETSVKVFRHNSWTARNESLTITVVREYLENIGYDPEDLFV